MNSRTLERPLSKFGVAIGASEHQNTVIETITALCEGIKSETSYVYVEDSDLLRAAELPFAVELSRITRQVSPLSSRELERQLQANATAVKQLVACNYHEPGSTWSFSVVRQRTADVVLELTKSTGPTIFVAANSAPIAATRVSNATLGSMRTSGEPTGIVVITDLSTASERSAVMAQKLAKKQGLPLHCLVIQNDASTDESLILSWCEANLIDASKLEILYQPAFDDIVKSVRAAHPTTVVVPISLVEGTAERIHELGETIHNPILIVP